MHNARFLQMARYDYHLHMSYTATYNRPLATQAHLSSASMSVLQYEVLKACSWTKKWDSPSKKKDLIRSIQIIFSSPSTEGHRKIVQCLINCQPHREVGKRNWCNLVRTIRDGKEGIRLSQRKNFLRVQSTCTHWKANFHLVNWSLTDRWKNNDILVELKGKNYLREEGRQRPQHCLVPMENQRVRSSISFGSQMEKEQPKLCPLLLILLLGTVNKVLFDVKLIHRQTFIGPMKDLKHTLKTNVGRKVLNVHDHHSPCLWPPLINQLWQKAKLDIE